MICSLLFILLPFLTFGQNRQDIDSLKQVIQTTTKDTTKIDALNDLGWKLMYSKPDTSIILSEEALKIAKGIGDKKRIADSYNNLGVYQYLKSNYPKALEYYFKALEIKKQ
ncbi:MAG: tetratricopeptide repeat protein, partial [Flavobacteriales bacterium]